MPEAPGSASQPGRPRDADREEGRDAGRDEGRDADREEGRDADREEGRDEVRDEGRARGYLDAVLRLDPAEHALQLFDQRRSFLALSFPPAYPPPYAHLPQRLECHSALEALRGQLEELPRADALARASEVEPTCLPDQRAWLARLVRYAEERERLERLAPRLDPELLAVFRRVLTAPIPEAVGLKETFLQRLWDRPGAAGLRRQVAHLRRGAPRLADLEPEWLDQVALREGPAFGRRHLSWVLLALVYLVLLLLRLLSEAP